MPQRAGGESRSKRPGVYHRPKPRDDAAEPPTPLVKGEAAENLDPTVTLFWDELGRLFADEGLSEPTGLWIIRPSKVWDGSIGIPTGQRGVEFERVRVTPGRHELTLDADGNIYEAGEPTGRAIVALQSSGTPDHWRPIDAKPARRSEPESVAPRRSQKQYVTRDDLEDDDE